MGAPDLKDVGFDALVARGEEHERTVLDDFRARDWDITEITSPFDDAGLAARETADALSSGVDVIYQAVLQTDARVGYPDFLVRADLLGGDNGYEVVDAKLARTAKARAVLQTTFYSALLAEQTGIEPRRMYLALGGGELATFDLNDFAAYGRQIGRLLDEFVDLPVTSPPEDTYPEPTEHCAICRWRLHCRARRREDDDLCLIANATSRQRKALKDAGVTTRRGFAALRKPPDLDKVSRASLARAHAQAKIQVEGEDAGEPRWELIEPERVDDDLVPDRGLLVLPEPAGGDLFFDIEGSRYYSEDGKEFGLQYLFGIVNTADLDAGGTPKYTAYWAFDRRSEKEAFESLMDFLSEHLNRYPNAHIYHYNHYEPTSMEHLSELHTTREDVLRRLMGRFATREDEVDNLLRRRLFVDLYRVVRQGIRASVESYSLKRLEPFCGFDRAVPLEQVNEQMVLFEMALDEGSARSDKVTQELIAGYNEDDCRATLVLRDWLEERREDLVRELGQELPRPVPEEPLTDTIAPEIKKLRAELLEGVPEEPDDRTAQQRARVLMADLLEYHRREEKPGWWRYFHLLGLTDEEFMEEPDAIAGLEFLRDVGPIKKSRLFEYRFPAQEFGFSSGDSAVDPITQEKWELHEIDEELGLLTIKRGPPSKLDLPHPTSLIAPGPEFMTTTHRQRIRELAEEVRALEADEWPPNATLDLLLRRPPRLDASEIQELRTPDETGLDAGRRTALALNRSCLPIQGPPGTGKTYTGANQIVDLALAGKRVGATAMSHAVITNLLDSVAQVASERGVTLRIGQRPGSDGQFFSQVAADAGSLYKNTDKVVRAFEDGEVDIVGGTTWVWTSDKANDLLDVLVIDEAGQMSIADVLASSHAAKTLILLGDPLQLAFPGQGSHPPTVPDSALDHILEGAATMPGELGLFLDKTRRMHPDITAFTSEVFYDGRLSGINGLERQIVVGEGFLSGGGVRIVEVPHDGNSNASPEEAIKAAKIIRKLLRAEWRDVENVVRPLTSGDVMVVTPFNAQIRQLHDAFEEAGLTEIRVGTVDKFQGRQAPVVVYSMAASSAEDAPRGLEFLFDPRRLNVATSRAKALAIVVASPGLFRVFGKTPRQMQLVNALCRLREMAIEM
jgi:predicted RecB family nuclease